MAVSKELATEVLQVYFLGYTGFRWPICHFPTCGVKASELYVMLWDVIAKLQDWGFTIDCILQDGGAANRQFINLHFSDVPTDSKYLAANIVNPSRVVAMCQDFSHIVKKIRNGIMKSGDHPSPINTRKLQLNGNYIVWQQWIDAVKWDRKVNSRPIHQKISDSHLFPDSSEKMRNHLAEEMLDADALNLLKCYTASLINGNGLDSTIELLETTSKMIEIFRHNRPIKNVHDDRIATVGKACNFCQDWRNCVLTNVHVPDKEKRKCILSPACCDDIESLLLSFPEICRIHLEEYPNGYIIPSRYNSDIIENHFCQQRGLHNGNATHPTYSSYLFHNWFYYFRSVTKIQRKEIKCWYSICKTFQLLCSSTSSKEDVVCIVCLS
ncbi:hypothetical protein BSL78_24364 [Apostichopus japonicus]|uniref:Transposable element P transposase-like RNase H domain-containing protein n=1 Tax=Stichopus japonicus TaxID=307972 RepID=A0A2G8JSW5_STIJA|nr:hypothetical protein BSL78_24364 [Apostichopus japonicus]